MNYCAHVSFGGAVISIIFVATKVCSDKHVLLRQNFCRLSQQAFFCRDENVFVATKDVFCRDKSMLVATQLLCRQLFYFNSIFCHGKHTFVVAKDVFCRNKSMLVATKILCRQSFCVCVCSSPMMLGYRTITLPFSYISHKFTSTLGLQFSPRIVTCNQ